MTRREAMKLARAAKKIKESTQPRKRREYPKRIRRTTKARFLKALKGTGGVKTQIAERLGCSYSSVLHLLKRPDWDDVRQAYEDEVNAIADKAETVVERALNQDFGPDHAVQTAKWVLTRARFKDRQMGDESKVTIEGGDNPLRTVDDTVDVERLNLPIPVKRALLRAMDAELEKVRKSRDVGDDVVR